MKAQAKDFLSGCFVSFVSFCLFFACFLYASAPLREVSAEFLFRLLRLNLLRLAPLPGARLLPANERG
jgi:hypothetical protein